MDPDKFTKYVTTLQLSRWLKPGGTLLPDHASLWVAGAALGDGDLEFWDSVYGFSMDPVRQASQAERLSHVAVAPVSSNDIITSIAQVQAFDLMTMHARDADFSSEFRVEAHCQVGPCTPPAHRSTACHDASWPVALLAAAEGHAGTY